MARFSAKGLFSKMRGMFSVTYVPPPVVVAAQFHHLAEEIKDFDDPIHRVVREVMMPSIAANFDAEGRPTWAPHAEGTRIISGDHPVLDRTGDLRAAATSFDLWTIDTAAGEAFVAGIDPFYGGFHQQGTSVMPMREFIVIQPEDADAIEQIFGDHVGDAINRVKIGI